MSIPKLETSQQEITILTSPNLKADFAPWQRDERGQQVFIKLTRQDECAYFFVGEHCQMDAEMQKNLLRLVNDGWSVSGELTLTFEGRNEPDVDPYVYQDAITVELGQALLPLVDPQQNAPLSSHLPDVRDSVAKELGLVPAGVRIKDNLRLSSNQYAILLKNAPVGVGELFLDRYLAIGTHEQISELQGWTTVDPTFRQPAKWITADFRDKADAIGCLVLGSLQVIMHHIQRVMIAFSPELLGLQDTYNLLARLQITHPVVIEDFVSNRPNLRRLHKVLRALLSEQVPIKELVTILECVGDALEETQDVTELTERCRRALSRQICWRYLNSEGELQALMLSDNIERVLSEVSEDEDTELTEELRDKITSAIENAWLANKRPPVLFTLPQNRPLLSRLLRTSIPQIRVLSTAELATGVRLIVNATVDINAVSPDKMGDAEPASPADETKEDMPELEAHKPTPPAPKKGRTFINVFTRRKNTDTKND
ncbi:MAG: FHIPEP family type III secretion protein [bacterium]|nr:FHIPEP family type III secretion protein [bacterium]